MMVPHSLQLELYSCWMASISTAGVSVKVGSTASAKSRNFAHE